MTDGATVTKSGWSPGELLAAQQRFLHLMYYDNHRVDIEGQLAAGQYGCAALITQLALQRGIVIYLLQRGEAGCDLHNAWAMFRRVCGAESELCQQALALLWANPLTDEEVVAHARASLAFITSRLGVTASGYHSADSFAEYGTKVGGIDKLVRMVRT